MAQRQLGIWFNRVFTNNRVKYLDGKQPIVTIVEAITEVKKNQQQEVIVIDVDEPEDFDGELSYD
ncbi:hypothetical protein NUACC21_58030 [Scytonema sp. NUACC21]